MRKSWLPMFVALSGVLVLFHAFFFQGYVLDANHDRRDISVPFALVCDRAAKAFTFPEWNPYIFAGTSALGSAAYVCFYPINWIAFAFSERRLPWLLTAILIVHVGLAYVFAYRFFRRLGGEPFWATVASTMYVFSSAAVMQMTAEINFSAFVYLPLILYFVAAEAGARSPLNMLGQGVSYALLIVGGNPQLALYAIAMSMGFGVARALTVVQQGARVDYRVLARSAGGLGLGLMLAAPRILPFYYSLKEAGGTRVSYEAFRAMSLTRPADTLRFLIPEIFGSSLHQHFFGTLNHFETFSSYVGVAGGILGLYAVLFVWSRRTAFWNVAFIMIVLVVLGTPMTRVHYVTTAGAQLLYNRLAWFLPLCVAALVSAHGAEILSRRGLRLFTLAALVAVLTALGYVGMVYLPDAALIAGLAGMTASVIHFGIFYLLFVGALIAAGRWGAQHRVARLLFLAPLALDLFLVARLESGNSNPFLSAPPFFRPTRGEADAAERIGRAGAERRQRVFRIPPDPRFSSYDKRTINNRFLYLGLYSSSGYDNSAPARVARLYAYPFVLSRVEERIVTPGSARAAELAATALVVSDDTVVTIVNALPRARLFTRYEVMSDDEALRRVLDPAFDPLTTVVLNHHPDRVISIDGEPGTADITADSGDRVEVRVTSRSPSVLLLVDTYHSGWQAEIDGFPAQILVANYAFRAVTVPAGSHWVVWRFRHPGLMTGGWLGVAGLAASVALGAAGTVSWRRASRGVEDPRPD